MAEPNGSTDPLASAYAAYEQFESRLSRSMDQLVATNGFAELFTTSASAMLGATRIVNQAVDEAVRATRLAARADVTSLARQLARTEDKLERLLQLVEDVSDRLAALEAADGDRGDSDTGSDAGSTAGSGGSTNGRAPRAARSSSGGSSSGGSSSGRSSGGSRARGGRTTKKAASGSPS